MEKPEMNSVDINTYISSSSDALTITKGLGAVAGAIKYLADMYLYVESQKYYKERM